MASRIDGGSLVIKLELDDTGFLAAYKKAGNEAASALEKTAKVQKRTNSDAKKEEKSLAREKMANERQFRIEAQETHRQEVNMLRDRYKVVKQINTAQIADNKRVAAAQIKEENLINSNRQKFNNAYNDIQFKDLKRKIKENEKYNKNLISTKVSDRATKLAKSLGVSSERAKIIGATAAEALPIVAGITAEIYIWYKYLSIVGNIMDGTKNILVNTFSRIKNMGDSFLNVGSSIVDVFDDVTNSIQSATSEIETMASSFNDFVSDAADYIEIVNVIQRAFDGNTDSIIDWSSSLASQFGITQKMAGDYVSTYGLLLNNYGFNGNITSEYAKTLTGLVGDWSSLTNIDNDTMANYFTSAIFGSNTRQLRNLGIDLGAAAMQQYMLEKGISGTYNALSQQDKVALKLQKTIENSDIAVGDFVRTQKTWANQVRILKNTLEQIQVYLGTGFITVAGRAIQYINTILYKLENVAYTFQEVMKKIFGEEALGTSAMSSSAIDALDELEDESEDTADSVTSNLKNALLDIDEISKLSSSSSTSTGSGTTDFSLPESDVYSSIFGDAIVDERVLTYFDEIYAIVDKIKSLFDHMADGWNNLQDKLGPFKTSISNLWNDFLKPIGNFTWKSLETFYDKFILGIARFMLTDDNGLIKLNNALSNLGKKIDWKQLNNDWGIFCSNAAVIMNGAFSGIIEIITRLTDKYDASNGSLLSQLNDFVGSIVYGSNWEKVKSLKNTAGDIEQELDKYSDYVTYDGSTASFKSNITKDSMSQSEYNTIKSLVDEYNNVNKNVNSYDEKIYNAINSYGDEIADALAYITKGNFVPNLLQALLVYAVTGDATTALGNYLTNWGSDVVNDENSTAAEKANARQFMKTGQSMESLGYTEFALRQMGLDKAADVVDTKQKLKALGLIPEASTAFSNLESTNDYGVKGISNLGVTKDINSITQTFSWTEWLGEELLKPNGITTLIPDLIVKVLKQVDYSTVIENIKQRVSGWGTNIGTSLATLGTKIGTNVSGWWSTIKLGFNTLKSNIGGHIGTWYASFKLKFDDLKTKLGSVIGGWGSYWKQKIGEWKTGISSGMDSLKERIKNGFLKIINGVIGIINGAIETINLIPGVNISKLDTVKGYANGGVFEPNSPRIIGIGDNTHEREVVSPLSTMKQAFREAMFESNGTNDTQKEITIRNYMTVDGKVLAQATNTFNNTNSWRQQFA